MKYFKSLYEQIYKVIDLKDQQGSNSSKTLNLKHLSNKCLIELEPLISSKMPMDRKFYSGLLELCLSQVSTRIEEVKKNKSKISEVIDESINELCRKMNTSYPGFDSSVYSSQFVDLELEIEDMNNFDQFNLPSEIEFNSDDGEDVPQSSKKNKKRLQQSNNNIKNSGYQEKNTINNMHSGYSHPVKGGLQFIDCVDLSKKQYTDVSIASMTGEEQLLSKARGLINGGNVNTLGNMPLHLINMDTISVKNPHPQTNQSAYNTSSNPIKTNSSNNNIFNQVEKITISNKITKAETKNEAIASKYATRSNSKEISNTNTLSNKDSNNLMLIPTNNILKVNILKDPEINNPNIVIPSQSAGGFSEYAKNFFNKAAHEPGLPAVNVMPVNQINYYVNQNNFNIGKQENYNINNIVVMKGDVSNNEEGVSPGKSPSKSRQDRRGVSIEKKGKRHRVTFIDRVDEKRLCDVVEIESYKQYNIDNTYNEGGHHRSSSESLSCCIIS
jgi:hypothetical protein